MSLADCAKPTRAFNVIRDRLLALRMGIDGHGPHGGCESGEVTAALDELVDAVREAVDAAEATVDGRIDELEAAAKHWTTSPDTQERKR